MGAACVDTPARQALEEALRELSLEAACPPCDPVDFFTVAPRRAGLLSAGLQAVSQDPRLRVRPWGPKHLRGA